MNERLAIVKKEIAPWARYLQKAFVPGLLGLFLSLNTLQAANSPAVTLTNKSDTSDATTRILLNAIRSAPRAGTNLLVKGPDTNQSGGLTNHTETGDTNGAPASDKEYKLAIGDHLSFRILEDQDDPRPIVVTDSGDIEVPYIGRVPAENKTCQQLAKEIKTELEKEYYYKATVMIAVDVMTKSHGRVYLAGAVRLPGPEDLPNDEVLTLSRAVLRAGGFTDYSDRRHVKVTRKDAANKDDKKTFVVDVGEIFDKGKIDTDLILEPGDLIFIPDRLVRF